MPDLCSISKQAAGLKGAQDSRLGSKTKLESIPKGDRISYSNGYNRGAMSIDLVCQQATNSPLYLPHEFMSPGDLYGGNIIEKVNSIYDSGASVAAKKDAIISLGKQEMTRIPDKLKPAFANYIGQRYHALDPIMKDYNPIKANLQNVASTFFSSIMKNNPRTSFSHLVGGTQRLIAGDLDAGGNNALQGILHAMQNAHALSEVKKNGLLSAADLFVHTAADHAAGLKYGDNPEMRSLYLSKTSYRYTPGEAPGYMMIGREDGAWSPFALARFAVREVVDPVGQVMNIAKYTMGDTAPNAKEKAAFAVRYLLGTTIAKGMVFGSAAFLPSPINAAAVGLCQMVAFATGDKDWATKPQDFYKKMDQDIWPLGLLQKTTGIDLTHHFLKGIPTFVAWNAIKDAGMNDVRLISSIGKAYETGNMNDVYKNLMFTAVDTLPFCPFVPQIVRDTNTTNVLRSTGYAIGGDIPWNEIPRLMAGYEMGHGAETRQQIQEGQQ